MAGKKKYTLIILSSRYAYIYSSHSYMSAANKKKRLHLLQRRRFAHKIYEQSIAQHFAHYVHRNL
jgi:hypothetical protein